MYAIRSYYEEVKIAYNEKRIDLHANIKVRLEGQKQLMETTVGRVLFNELVPKEVGYLNVLLTSYNFV